MTVALETHFTESAKNCVLHYFNTSKSILIFMPSTNNNQTKVLTMLEKAVDIFEYIKDSFPFELWTVALETPFADFAKNCLLHYINTSKSILIFMPSTNEN